jgi:SAM-dependent methyltransferase
MMPPDLWKARSSTPTAPSLSTAHVAGGEAAKRLPGWWQDRPEVSSLYDRIGGSYRATRRPDRRIAALINPALGDASSVLNVGAGAGAYEPRDREVLAVEPSATMIQQRPPGSAPVIQASAENLPLDDDSFDAALAVNAVLHWTDLRAGLRELRRVSRIRVVIFLRAGGKRRTVLARRRLLSRA